MEPLGSRMRELVCGQLPVQLCFVVFCAFEPCYYHQWNMIACLQGPPSKFRGIMGGIANLIVGRLASS